MHKQGSAIFPKLR